MKYILLSLCILLLLGGCEDEIFFRIYNKKIDTTEIEEINLEVSDKKLLTQTKEILNKQSIKITKTSPYKLIIYSSFYKECKLDYQNVAYGASYNGYIRISLYKEQKEIVRVQQEFKDEITKKMLKNLLEKIF